MDSAVEEYCERNKNENNEKLGKTNGFDKSNNNNNNREFPYSEEFMKNIIKTKKELKQKEEDDEWRKEIIKSREEIKNIYNKRLRQQEEEEKEEKS